LTHRQRSEELSKNIQHRGIGLVAKTNHGLLYPNRQKGFEWMLFEDYINRKIARLYRAMVTHVYTGRIDLKNLYRRKNPELFNKKMLLNLGSAASEFFTKPTKSDIADWGYTRKAYFERIIKIINFSYWDDTNQREVPCNKLNTLIDYLNTLDCLTFDLKNSEYAYCSEEIICLLMDYCFSAMAYGIDWGRVKNNERISNRWRKFMFLDSDPSFKCTLHLKRSTGGVFKGLSYSYLELRNPRPEQTHVSKNAPHDSPGMSLNVTRWYIDQLWREFANQNTNPPFIEMPEKNGAYFVLKLPILKPATSAPPASLKKDPT
jgi:hypothetical protein